MQQIGDVLTRLVRDKIADLTMENLQLRAQLEVKINECNAKETKTEKTEVKP